MMLRFHIRQNLRSAFFLAVLLVALALPALLWQANRSGLPDSWRAFIERELGNQGVHLQIGAIQYHPLRGIAARDVRIFADPEHLNELSSIGRILLDFDKTKLARGDLRLNKMQLTRADVLIPADATDPDSEVLALSEVYGELRMPGGRVLEVRNARGKVGQVNVRLNARLLGYRSSGAGQFPQEDKAQRGKRRELIALLSRELERWTHAEDQPPEVEIRIHGDLADLESFRSRFEFKAPSLSLNHHAVEEIHVSGQWLGKLLLLDHFQLSDARGTLEGRAEYDTQSRTGRFDAECTLDLISLARSWFGMNTPDGLLVGGGQSINTRGKFELASDGSKPRIEATGALSLESVMLRGVVFDRVQSAFAVMGNEFFFRDAKLSRPDGVATGKVLIQWPLVRLALESTLPAPVYEPFFVGQPLEHVLELFDSDDQSSVEVVLEGGFDATNRLSWAYQGHGTANRLKFNDVPVFSATTKFSLSHHELDFRDGELVLDTTDYPQRTAHGGPARTTISVGGIRFINHERMIEVRDVAGEFWVSPMLALFNRKLADQLESYKFHRPPNLAGSGIIDLTPAGRTKLDVRFDTPTKAATGVLGQQITFDRAKGSVLLRGNRVEVNGLDLVAFDGPVKASFSHEGGRFASEVSWTRINLPALAGVYGVTMQGGGTTTGRVEFTQRGGNVATLKGAGHAGFENAHLFAVPILGPLSPLIATVVDDRRTGYERAKDAFLTFDMENGVIRSNDFRTTTTSLTFTGDGQIDLNDNTVDMTMRVNARGLLGIITLPLRPFYGLFQFRGTGPMREPTWENVMFTNPPPDQRKNLLDPPKARVIREP